MEEPEGLRVLGISGSLRRGSYNRMLLLNVLGRLPAGVEWSIADIGGLPILTGDDLEDPPEPALRLRGEIAAADLVVI